MTTKESAKYEYTRTIRFKLEGDLSNFESKLNSNLDESLLLAEFTKAFEDLIKCFEDLFTYSNKLGAYKIRSRLEIKKSWMRQYSRDSYYQLTESDRNKNKYSANVAENSINKWIKENNNTFEYISSIQSTTNDRKTRKSDLFSFLLLLNSKDYLGFIDELIMEGILNDKDNSESVKILKDKANIYKSLLSKMISTYAPNMKHGIEVARASFNYYTINKISKHFDKELQEIKNNLNTKYNLSKDQIDILTRVDYPNVKAIDNISIDNLYNDLKRFKSDQKKAFLEAINQDKPINSFRLFETKNETLSKFKNENSKKRGEYFRYRSGFPNYVDFNDKVYKQVAVKLGRIKADIRSIEKDIIDARLLNYWANVIIQNHQKYILLIPKYKMASAKNYIDSIKHEQSDYILSSFNSLTLRALNKLIRRNLGKEQTFIQTDAVNLYQDVLKGKYPELKDLDFSGFEKDIQTVADKKYTNEEHFRKDLEKIAYICKQKAINEIDLTKIKNDFDGILLKISSYDLMRNIDGDYKEHTKIWESFWNKSNIKNNYPVRINPEIRLFYRPRQKSNDLKKSNNRFSKDQLGIAFTLSNNAAQKRLDTSYAKEKDIIDMFYKFNVEVIGNFVNGHKNDLWYYGIDRGQQELATLCIVRFSDKKYKSFRSSGEIDNLSLPIPAGIKTYRIKNEHLNDTKDIVIDRKGNKKTIMLFKNPSYFIEDKEKFEEITTPSIDLTTAKLIKGKIIQNGDLQTYISLKIANARRQLFDKLHKIDPSSKIEYDNDMNRFQIKSNSDYQEREKYQYLPYYNTNLDRVYPIETMQKELQSYLDLLRQNNTKQNDDDFISIEKINNLRDAITSNMVGIIAYLYNDYPGIINLENMHSKDKIERHFHKNNENISRLLEWSLYKKFQKIGLVPPNLRQTIFLREEKTETDKYINQFGIIHFIPIENTSSSCPYCGYKVPSNERKDDKFRHHAYVCKNEQCGFNTNEPKHPLEFITNSDIVAAYNIAKVRLI